MLGFGIKTSWFPIELLDRGGELGEKGTMDVVMNHICVCMSPYSTAKCFPFFIPNFAHTYFKSMTNDHLRMKRCYEYRLSSSKFKTYRKKQQKNDKMWMTSFNHTFVIMQREDVGVYVATCVCPLCCARVVLSLKNRPHTWCPNNPFLDLDSDA